jgi:DNA-binding NarL/FixJ family response regulator
VRHDLPVVPHAAASWPANGRETNGRSGNDVTVTTPGAGRPPIRLLIVDDHAIVRQGLEQLFATMPDVRVVGTADDGERAVAQARALAPDVVLMDIRMPKLDGVDATRRIVADDPRVRVVILTSYEDDGQVAAARRAGAVGYLLKHSDPPEVVKAVRAAYEGNPTVPGPGWPDSGRAQWPAPGLLTPRERQVLALVGEGLSNRQIAHRLGITERTVKHHLTNVFATIGVTDRVHAALWAGHHLPHS